jgi:hypothetical protein
LPVVMRHPTRLKAPKLSLLGGSRSLMPRRDRKTRRTERAVALCGRTSAGSQRNRAEGGSPMSATTAANDRLRR